MSRSHIRIQNLDSIPDDLSKWRYINESRLDLNESDHEDWMTKKGLRELKVIIYTNKMHLLFQLEIGEYHDT